jgi:acetyl esterase/lipase
MKVISVHYRLRPAGAGNQDIVAVYREVLKTYTPKKVAFFGTSGGCTFAITTAIWLQELKLPEPGVLGLMTCSGGSQPGDTRITHNGLDPLLSMATRGQPPRVGPPPPEAPYGPDKPPATALDGRIPTKGFPVAFLLSGTRDMCLSQTVLLQRKLRRANVKTELYVAEGMWHGFHGDSNLPEAREAMETWSTFLKANL